MAGNAKEWCWNASGEKRYILGGGWSEPSYLFVDPDARSAFERADTYLTLGVFAAALLLLVARAALWRAVLGASLGMVAVWAVFRFGLGVRLPTGEFWDSIRDLVAAKFNGAS